MPQILEVRKDNVPPTPTDWSNIKEVRLYDPPRSTPELCDFIGKAKRHATIVSMSDEVREAMDEFTTEH